LVPSTGHTFDQKVHNSRKVAGVAKKMNENQIGNIVVDCCVAIHKELGPGLLESVYEIILLHKLRERGLKAARQVAIPLEYQGIKFEEGFRADIIIDEKVILELKSIETVHKCTQETVVNLP